MCVRGWCERLCGVQGMIVCAVRLLWVYGYVYVSACAEGFRACLVDLAPNLGVLAYVLSASSH